MSLMQQTQLGQAGKTDNIQTYWEKVSATFISSFGKDKKKLIVPSFELTSVPLDIRI